jgi:ABC-2 type transport system ATP-binding protein
MRQRLALAQALLPRPELVLLDEPAEGLDPEGIHEMRHLILRLNRERGMTVILSSHLLAEVEQLCDSIAVLNQGRMIFHGNWADLKADAARYELDVEPWDTAAALIAARTDCSLGAERTLTIQPGHDVADVIAALVHGGVKVRAVSPVRQTLEQIYLELVGTPRATVTQ